MMNKIGKKLGYKEDGFTIIEVMIVLAVAGLIMAIVLVAIPQLQRSQRDESSRNTVNRVLTEMGSYAGNNNGVYPTSASSLTTFKSNYLADVDIKHPKTGNNYEILLSTSDSAASAVSPITQKEVMTIHPGANCSGESVSGTSATSTTSRSVAIRVELERNNTFYCADNS